MITLVFDARMITYSGIGRYIRFILPFYINNNQYSTKVIGIKKEILHFFPDIDESSLIEVTARVYSPGEHYALKKAVPPCDVFISPHFNTPLLKIKARKRITVIHDLFHLTENSGYNGIKKGIIRLLVRNALKRSHVIMTISQFQKNEIEKFFSKSKTPVHVVYHGFKKTADQGTTTDSKNPLKSPYILYVGNIKPHKNLLRLIKAFEKTEIQDLKLVLLGKRDNFISPDKTINSIIDRLKDNIIFTGFVEDSLLSSWYSHAEFLVHPSLYEGFGMTPMEALVNGTAVLISDIPVLKEIYGDTAEYINPYSIDDIAEKIIQLHGSSERRENIIQNGRKLLSKYSEEACYAGHKRVLDHCIGTGGVEK